MKNARKTLHAGAVAVALTAALAACGGGGTGSPQGEKTITLGLLTPLSGPAATYGPPERASLRAAVERINSEGGVEVGGERYTFALKTYDTAYNPSKAVTVAREAINQDGLRYLEVLGGGIVPSVQPIAEPANVMVFAAAAGGEEFIGPEHPLTFRPYYSIPDSVSACLQYLRKELGAGATVVRMYPDDTLGHSLAPKVQKRTQELGYASSTVFVPRDTTDFASILTRLKTGTDVIDFGPLPPSQYGPIVEKARQFGYDGTFVFPDTIDLKTVLKSASEEDLAGSVVAPAFEQLESDAFEQWASEMRDRVGQVQGWTAQSYDNLFLLKTAMEKANSTKPKAVAETLAQVSTNGILGEVSYGGENEWDIPRVFQLTYPVAKVTQEGELEQMASVTEKGGS